MEKVRAKFDCIKKTETKDGFGIELHAIADSDGENEGYFKYTPFGELQMELSDQKAAEMFIPGQMYYLDLFPASFK